MKQRHRAPLPKASERGGAATRVASDYIVQFARVGASGLSTETAATMFNVEGPGGEKTSGVDGYGAFGVVFRPMLPGERDGHVEHAEAVCVRTADGLVPIAWRDVRLNRAFPNPQVGDLAFVGYGSNFLKLGADGSIFLATTTDATPQGEFVQMQLKGNAWNVVAPWGKITYDDKGFHLLHYSGARIDLGGIGGAPAPLNELGSYLTLSAAMVKIQGSIISLGPTGDSQALAKATSLQVVLESINLALQGIGAALTALGSIPANNPAAGAIATAVAAIGTAATAVTAGAVAIPSLSTGGT